MLDFKALLEAGAKTRRLPDDYDTNVEAEYYTEIQRGPLEQTFHDHDILEYLGAGGSGTVFLARYKPLDTLRCIKLPRQAFVARMRASDDQSPRINPERHALEKLNHRNIVRLFAAPQIADGVHAFVMDFVPGALELDEFISALLAAPLPQAVTRRAREAKRTRMDMHLRTFAKILYDIGDALSYMHTIATIYHFDIKPSNILVATDGTPFITDLGFARDATHYAPDKDVEVGFTWKFAHPDLTDPYGGRARITRTPAKSRGTLAGRALGPKFDLFALGRTIQAVLRVFEVKYGEEINSHYDFVFLHLLACLLLDGHNSPAKADASQPHDFVSDVALDCDAGFFSEHRVSNTVALSAILERLNHTYQLEAALPELNPWHPRTLNSSDLGPVVFTARVAAIVSHPAFARLDDERQLGSLNTVYPTALHTRANHSVGTYHAVCKYVMALYHDPEVPIFRMIASESDIRALLVAGLLHDLGQSSLGHDLEEVDETVYSHEAFSARLLEDKEIKDDAGRTVRDIIEAAEPEGWGVPLQRVAELVRRRVSKPLDGVLVDCIDGVTDADKLDYIIRDSVDARVPYGRALDVERFLRALTVSVRQTKAGKQRASLAIRAKGRPAAEAFAFARYALYGSLYWHHTYRAVKAMILDAACRQTTPVATAGLLGGEARRDLYYYFVVRRLAWEEAIARSVLQKVSAKRAKQAEAEVAPKDVVKERALEFLWRIGDAQARVLIERVARREIVQRIFELPVHHMKEEAWIALPKLLGGTSRRATAAAVQTELLKALRTRAQDLSSIRSSITEDHVIERIDAMKSDDSLVVIDCPLRGWMPGGEAPFEISDYRRKHFVPSADSSDRSQVVWADVLPKLMRTIAVFRVLCAPELAAFVGELLKPTQIWDVVATAVPALKIEV